MAPRTKDSLPFASRRILYRGVAVVSQRDARGTLHRRGQHVADPLRDAVSHPVDRVGEYPFARSVRMNMLVRAQFMAVIVLVVVFVVPLVVVRVRVTTVRMRVGMRGCKQRAIFSEIAHVNCVCVASSLCVVSGFKSGCNCRGSNFQGPKLYSTRSKYSNSDRKKKSGNIIDSGDP